ncbi:hypothetical protein QAD02_018547 [Eretmocerus hayati]|uniref:Uncharacterized protein n=1 Tax=Eretmocerus hayati TaxID=131215 RepID=A0ACC2PLW4_9HYME|nr:hypothetical protein QAD02_018547 [Eretmocerus hayati]
MDNLLIRALHGRRIYVHILQNSLDVGKYATLGDSHVRKQLVQLLVVTNGKLEMTRDDPGLLVVTSGIACQLQDFGRQVLHHGCEVDRGSGTNSFGVVALTEQTMDPSNRELETGTGRPGLLFALGGFASFASSRHLRLSI